MYYDLRSAVKDIYLILFKAVKYIFHVQNKMLAEFEGYLRTNHIGYVLVVLHIKIIFRQISLSIFVWWNHIYMQNYTRNCHQILILRYAFCPAEKKNEMTHQFCWKPILLWRREVYFVYWNKLWYFQYDLPSTKINHKNLNVNVRDKIATYNLIFHKADKDT